MVRRRVPLVLADEWDERFRQLVYLKDKIPPARVRDFLTTESMVARHLFLRLFVSTELADPALVRRWQRGCGVLADLSLTYAWGSKQLKAKLRALAEDAEILAALQGAAARGTHVSRTMLAVLVIDASRDSIDALLPSLDPALMTPDTRLEWLQALRTHAKKTPELAAILGEIDQTIAQRAAASPALALGPVIGLGEVKLLWFNVRISSEKLDSHVPVYQGTIDLDSRSSSWFRVWLTYAGPPRPGIPNIDRSTVFGSSMKHARDILEVGRCEPHELPRWLATASRLLNTKLEVGNPSSNLRGAKRERIVKWLEGG
jgi:hypothetical protein